MKTAREWFKELPDDIEEMAIENAESADMADDSIFRDLMDAIGGAFVWKDTEQGHAFWSNVEDQHANK